MKRRKLSKKDIERWHLCRFEESYADFPSGEVHPGETPDFRIVSLARSIGIELTQVFHQEEDGRRPLQEIERLRDLIVEKAETLYSGTDGPPLDVLVYFSGHAVLTKATMDRLAERLAALVGRRVPEPGQSYAEEFDWVNRGWFPEELSYVRVARFAQRDWGLWRVSSVGYVAEVTPELVQAAIDRKAPDITAYRTSCDEAWLLIIADGFNISSTMSVTQQSLSHQYRSPFDRTIYFDNFRKQAHELAVG